MSKKMLLPALVALILLGGAALVSAHQVQDEEAEESTALKDAKITLSGAIAAAEKEVPGGRVIDAEVDFQNGVASYFIEIDKDGVQRVRVDMQTGQVSKVTAETDDTADEVSAHQDDEDEDEDED